MDGYAYQANIASQQLEMISENLIKENSTDGYLTNITSIAYLMELCSVSWNNLLIAHNYRKLNGLSSKLIFNKTTYDLKKKLLPPKYQTFSLRRLLQLAGSGES